MICLIFTNFHQQWKQLELKQKKSLQTFFQKKKNFLKPKDKIFGAIEMFSYYPPDPEDRIDIYICAKCLEDLKALDKNIHIGLQYLIMVAAQTGNPFFTPEEGVKIRMLEVLGHVITTESDDGIQIKIVGMEKDGDRILVCKNRKDHLEEEVL